MRDKLIRFQNLCIKLGRLKTIDDAIDYTVFVNDVTLKEWIEYTKSEIDALRDEILGLMASEKVLNEVL